jgi:nucleoside-diphosphate-sugar epimerase
MKIFLAGGSGVIGWLLVPALVAAGHEVTVISKRKDGADAMAAQGAQAVIGDVLDADRLTHLVGAARPEAVIQHLTSIPQDVNPRNTEAAYAREGRTGAQGSANLLAAAKAAGARRYLAQNVCYMYAATGPSVVGEDAPLATDVPGPYGQLIRAHAAKERHIIDSTELEGLVLRTGFWYGPGTSFASGGYTAQKVRRRRYPVIGDGAGVFSFVHIHDVVAATIAALGQGAPGVYNVCDDDPAPVREWLPLYARALHAPAPRHVPLWLGRLLVGPYGVVQATQMRGASNHKAREQLGWTLKYATWREGFVQALG